MIDVSGGYLGNPAVETAGFKMIDVNRASILSNKQNLLKILRGPIFKKIATDKENQSYLFWLQLNKRTIPNFGKVEITYPRQKITLILRGPFYLKKCATH